MRLTFDGLWTWIAIALPAFVSLLVPLPAVDLAYQVRAGDEILATGAIPAVDTWTFTVAGTPWVDQQWLAQVKLALLYALGGWELLAVARAGLVALLTGMLVAVARARGATPRTAAILALAAFALAAPALALRPQLFAIVQFAILLWLVAERHRRPGVFLAAPLVAAAWANVHGSFVLGPAILAYAWVADVASGRPWRRSLAVAVVGTIATLANPYLGGAWAYAVGIGANPVIAGQVSEWQRTSPLEMPGMLFYPSVIVTAALLWWRRGRLRWPGWVLLAATAAMGAWAVRGVAWWAPVMVFLLAGALSATARVETPPAPSGASPAPLARRAHLASRANGALAGMLGVLLVAALPWWRPGDPLTGRAGLLSHAPSPLATALAGLVEPGDRVVVPQTWASWFEWSVPEASYFVDSRFELFPPAVWADHEALADVGADALAVLDRWGVDVLVVDDPGARPLPGWDLVGRTDEGLILRRGRR